MNDQDCNFGLTYEKDHNGKPVFLASVLANRLFCRLGSKEAFVEQSNTPFSFDFYVFEKAYEPTEFSVARFRVTPLKPKA